MRKIFSFILLWATISLCAQIPEGYYDDAEDKSNAALKTALHNKIKVGKRLSYGSGAGKTWSGFAKTDLHPEGYVWDMYSTVKRYFPDNGGSVSGMNIEHSVAKSWWGGTSNDAYKDLYHLNPSDVSANSARSNYPLGTNSGSRFNNGSIKVGNNTADTEYTGLCFEPLDEYKGDFARAYLYMFTCYENYSWTGTQAPTMLNATETWPMLKPWAKELLLKWCRQDPVSPKEQKRADEIFKIQENRNPYIDYPELVEHLWGNLVGQTFSTNQTNPVITSPMQGTTIAFPETHYSVASEVQMQVTAKRLTGDLTLTLSGDKATQFALSSTSISKEQAESGAFVTLTYMPQKAETLSVSLTLQGGGVATPVQVTLTAKSVDNFMALPATNITSSGFVANWTSSSTATDYELSVYKEVIENQGGVVTLVETEFNDLPSGWTTTGYKEIKDGEIRLASSNQDGSIVSSDFDLSLPSTLTFKAKRYGSDSSPVITISVDGEAVESVTMEADYKDYAIELPAFTDESNIELSALKSKRVNITSLKLVTGGEKISYPLVEGYPKRTGLVSSYEIVSLEANQNYNYTVQTIGGDQSISSPVSVTTLNPSSLVEKTLQSIRAVSSNGKLYLFDLPVGGSIQVTDLTGRILLSKEECTSQEAFAISYKGFALVRVRDLSGLRTMKVRVH